MNRRYIAIDLKSFYASVECVERGLDPLDACLVVADRSRTDKTICLAVSPALKSFGLGGRPRLFEVAAKVREVNRHRGRRGVSTSGRELAADPSLALDYIVARPRMGHYIAYSKRIYEVYLRHVAPEDIFAYSVDEVFIDATEYLRVLGLSAHDFAMRLVRDVLATTGVTATAGIGTNMYLCKIAMDIMAKKMPPDKDGVRVAELDEMSFRRELWGHRPITDFWRIGRGTAARLALYGVNTMGDLARLSLTHEELLYRVFGVNAELLIDHAWGWEPVGMKEVKAYRPETHSICSGRVLSAPYTAAKARIVVLEIADATSLELLDQRRLTDHMTLDIGYDRLSLADDSTRAAYAGRVAVDRYGREVPPSAHGSVTLSKPTSAASVLMREIGELYDRIVDSRLYVRRVSVSFCRLIHEGEEHREEAVQLDLFTDYEAEARQREAERRVAERERRRQQAILDIKKTFGKNAILRGLNFAEGATQRERNGQIGGHRE